MHYFIHFIGGRDQKAHTQHSQEERKEERKKKEERRKKAKEGKEDYPKSELAS